MNYIVDYAYVIFHLEVIAVINLVYISIMRGECCLHEYVPSAVFYITEVARPGRSCDYLQLQQYRFGGGGCRSLLLSLPYLHH